jgi:glycosyltransferase involved in cell wall biosynthesis
MRIVLVSDSYPPLIGGATRATQLLALGLLRDGHEVDVVTTWQAGAPSTEVFEGVHVHRIPGVFSGLYQRFRPDAIRDRFTPPSLPDPLVVLRCRRLLRRRKPDVIVSYGWLSYSVWLASLGLSARRVLSLRDYGNVCALRTLLRDGAPCSGPSLAKCLPCASAHYGRVQGVVGVLSVLGQRPLLRRGLAGVQSCSGYVEGVARRHLLGGLTPVTAVIPDYSVAADTVGRAGAGARPAGLPDAPYILFVGALRRVKGIDVLIEAYGRLTDPPPLVLIGTKSPDPLPPLPAGVILLGAVPHDGVMAAWSGALFGVAPSIWAEPLGNVAHEALSCGVPMIGSREGGHDEMITHGVNGLLVGNGKVEELTEAMQTLISDDEMRGRFAAAAADSVSRFVEAVQLPAWESFLSAASGSAA